MRTAIVADSTCGLHPDTCDEMGIELVCASVELDGRSRRDWSEIEPAEVYAALREGRPVQTTPPNYAEFTEVYERSLGYYDRLISVHSSSEMSLSYLQAILAARAVAPNRIAVVDSMSISAGLAALVQHAWGLLKSGADEDHILRECARAAAEGWMLFTAPNLDNLIKGGRLDASVKSFEHFMGVRPIIGFRMGGLVMQKQILEEYLIPTLTEEAARRFSGRHARVTVAHADAGLETLAQVRDGLRGSKLDNLPTQLVRLSPSVAAHVGDSALGIHVLPLG